MGTQLTPLFVTLLTLAVYASQSSYTSSSACPPYFNGSIAGNSCSREYIVCVNGIQQKGVCEEGLVFYEQESNCIDIAESPECAVPNDEEGEEEEKEQIFDCSLRNDGSFAVGCSNQFVQCVAGYAYPMFCPSDLFYVEKYGKCLYSCDAVLEENAEAETPASYPQKTESEQENEEVYDEIIPAPTEQSDATTTTASAYTSSSSTTSAPLTLENDDVDFDCSKLEDGNYAQGCSSFFYVCSSGNTYISHCPSGLVYNPSQRSCDYECSAATTTTSVPITTTTVAEDVPSSSIYGDVGDNETSSTTTTTTTTTTQAYQLETTTEVFDDETTTTSTPYVAVTTPGFDDANVTSTPICRDGQISYFGQCASRFTKCQNNAIRTKQCPASTLFETSVLLCVFDSPLCQPKTVPVQVYSNPDVVVSPFDDERKHFGYNGRRHNTIIENPFFTPSNSFRHRHHRKHHDGHRRRHDIFSPFATRSHGRRTFLDDSFKDHRRVRMDRIRYADRRPQGSKVFRVDDSFEGHHQKFLGSNIRHIFQKGNSRRRLGPNEYPDDYEDGSGFEPKDLFGATRKKRSVSYSNQQYGASSQPSYSGNGGYGSYSQVSDRQARVNAACKPYTKPTFLSFGDCFDQFIYCSGNGINRFAACPIGETFDRSLGVCSENCGVATTSAPTVVTTTTSFADDTTASQSYNPTASDQASTQASPIASTTVKVPIGQKCAQFSDALVSLGCSQEYIHCSSGVAIRRVCPAALYFDESRSLCDYREAVSECTSLGEDTPSTTASSYYPPQYSTTGETSTYAPTMKPYSPTTAPENDTPVDACNGLSDGSHGEGCSASYILCSGGKLVKALTCSLGQGFDPSSQLCKPFEQIDESVCNSVKTTTDSGLAQPLPYVSLDSVTSTDSSYRGNEDNAINEDDDEYVPVTSTESSEVDPLPVDEDDNDDDEEEEESTSNVVAATPVCQAGSRASTGFCLNSYLECDPKKNVYEFRACLVGDLFDGSSNACVKKDKCGHAAIKKIVQDTISTTADRTIDRRCFSAADNSVRSVGNCRTSFIRCTHGQAHTEYCPGNQVFSKSSQACVNRSLLPECSTQQQHPSAQPQKSAYNRPTSSGDSFCNGKPDGLFKNPSDCSGILQCFGGDVFEYPSCPAGLAFNELIGKCDYTQNVAGCERSEDSQGECSEHGAFIADPDNCSSFYRCVWQSKVAMKCPSGTVFNPSLSVCDWPSSVPQCSGVSNPVASDSKSGSGY